MSVIRKKYLYNLHHTIKVSNRIVFQLFIGGFLILLFTKAAVATSITGTARQGSDPCTSADKKYKVSLTHRPVQYLENPTADDINLLKKEYPNWTFTDGATAAGTFNILEYETFCLNTLGGADYSVLYDDGNATQTTDYNWLQIGRADDWGSLDNKTFIDSKYSNFPFYSNYTPDDLPTLTTPTSFYGDSIWLTAESTRNIQNPAGGGNLPKSGGDLLFVDEPYCSYSYADKDGFAALDLDLFLVTFTWNNKLGSDAGGTVTIHDGMRWGVSIAVVPEPSNFLLLNSGLVCLIIIGRKRAFKRA